jgi:hypothetical protein
LKRIGANSNNNLVAGRVNTPKRQHIIPCLHLRHFAGDDPAGQVWNYDAQSGRVWSAAPENTAVEGHFYSGERDDGSMDSTIEEHLASVENSAVSVYTALLRGEIPGESQERADFAHFVALMFSRTRAMRRMAAEGYGKFMQIMLYAYANDPDAFDSSIRRYEEETGQHLSPDQREHARQSMIDPSKFEFIVPKERTLTALSTADKLAAMFYNMKWWVMNAAYGYFITSDNPVVREVDPRSVSPFYGDGGFANKTVEVTFPLSPQKLLLMTWNDLEYRREIDGEAVWAANMARASHSEQFLYAHRYEIDVANLAAEFREVRPGMRMSGFGPKKFGNVRLRRRRERK